MKKKILFDISHGIHGNTGIQQDMRRILQMISNIDDLEIDILIYDMINNDLFTDFDIQKNIDEYGSLVAQSRLSYYYFNPDESNKFNSRFLGRIRRYLHTKSIIENNNVKLLALDKKYNESFYRKLLFDDHKDGLLEKFKKFQIFLSTYSTEGSIIGMMDEKYKIPFMDTSSYDIVIFFQELPIKISSTTKKIVRSFDLIQIFGPDVVFKADYKANYQYKSIKHCIEQDSLFLPISEFVENEIKHNFDGNIKTKVISVAVSNTFDKKNDDFDIFHFIEGHDNVKDSQLPKIYGKNNLKYFLSVSTIEPRKNIISSFRAFKKLKQEKGNENLIFILVGKIGWSLDQQYKQMLKDKDVIVLPNISTEDLPILYSNAVSLVYVPFQEGFGLPPAEAMLCECPVILSNIPVHKEIYKENAFYVDHYDIDSIYDQMSKLLKSKNNKEFLNKILNAKKYVKKYTISELSKTWKELLLNL